MTSSLLNFAGTNLKLNYPKTTNLSSNFKQPPDVSTSLQKPIKNVKSGSMSFQIIAR
jgi:hypothetical protein